MKLSGKVKQIQDVKEMLKIAAQMEESSAKDYNNWANECAKNADAVSKQLFESLVGDEERHFDQFDDEIENPAGLEIIIWHFQSIERSKKISG